MDVTAMFANLNGWHLLIILAVVLLLFGAPKLPGLARSVGQSMRIFRGEIKTMNAENSDVAPEGDASVVSSDADTSAAPVKPVSVKPVSVKPVSVKPAPASTVQGAAKSTSAKPKP
jgi:sec-independent protein translocase protein TatA